VKKPSGQKRIGQDDFLEKNAHSAVERTLNHSISQQRKKRAVQRTDVTAKGAFEPESKVLELRYGGDHREQRKLGQ